MKATDVTIEESWKEALAHEFDKPYFDKIKSFLVAEMKVGKIIYPHGKLIFNAYNLCPLQKIKVVILGQDPYHNTGEAMGLSFSVPKGIKIPPSLMNIYKELQVDCKTTLPNHGDLTTWGNQGVFLLNAMLTVEKNKPLSHKNIGWQEFTDATISIISDKCDHVVFLLWGNFAKSKADLIDAKKHLILTSAHPSPLAGKAFFNNNHFSKANEFLKSYGHNPINWQIE
jgi:uracil-DNA glycosylase